MKNGAARNDASPTRQQRLPSAWLAWGEANCAAKQGWGMADRRISRLARGEPPAAFARPRFVPTDPTVFFILLWRPDYAPLIRQRREWNYSVSVGRKTRFRRSQKRSAPQGYSLRSAFRHATDRSPKIQRKSLTSSTVEATCSFSISRARWFSTVRTLISSASAIFGLDFPATTSSAI